MSRRCPQCGGRKDFYAEMCRVCRYGPPEKHRYKCAECGSQFTSYNPNPQFCSNRCRGDSMMADLDTDTVRKMYASGMTQSEIAEAWGVSQRVVWRHMARYGIRARPQVKRNQWGHRNDSWRGDAAGYAALHKRVEVLRGKPRRCFRCGVEGDGHTYDWANKTGNYADPADYIRLCRSCHWKMDGRVENLRRG